MSQLTKSLKTRIEELTTSIEAQAAELAAYKEVLRIEVANEAPTEASPSESTAKARPVSTNGASSVDLTGVEFTGNKTAFVVAIVKAHGAAGATPKEIRDVFASRNIPQNDNLIYTTLSALAKDKKLKRRDGRYFGVGSATVSKTASPAPSVAPAKKKMSPAAIKKIREGVKKYWAAKKAAAK
jgi:hypothetical protein